MKNNKYYDRKQRKYLNKYENNIVNNQNRTKEKKSIKRKLLSIFRFVKKYIIELSLSIIVTLAVSIAANYLTIKPQNTILENKLNDIKFNTSEFHSYIETNFKATIYFNKATSLIDSTGKKELKNLLEKVSKVKKNEKYIISIEGFASSETLSKYNNNYENNYELSFARALNVKKNMIDILVQNKKAISIKFNLSAKATEKSTSEHDKSRKVEIKFYMWNNQKDTIDINYPTIFTLFNTLVENTTTYINQIKNKLDNF